MIDLILFALVVYLVYGALASVLSVAASAGAKGEDDVAAIKTGCGIARWLVAAGLATIAWNWPEWLPL